MGNILLYFLGFVTLSKNLVRAQIDIGGPPVNTNPTNSPLFIPFQTVAKPHQLKYINNNQYANLVKTPQYSSNNGNATENTGYRFLQPTNKRICAEGMWALYSRINYGERFETETQVITIMANSLQTCSSSSNCYTCAFLPSVHSLRYLGNQDRFEDGLDIFTHRDFLGGEWKVFDTADAPAGGFRLGSLAITGPSAWKICEDVDCSVAICVDNSLPETKMFMETDTISATNAQWPRIVRRVERISNGEESHGHVCDGLPTPYIPPAGNSNRQGVQSVDEDAPEEIKGPNGGIFKIKVSKPQEN